MASNVPRLHRAAARGEKGTIQQYLSSGDDVNARDTNGRTALLYAVSTNHINCVVALLAQGADPSASDNDMFFPLYVAAQNKNSAIAKALIRAHADINAIFDKPGAGTALSLAVFMGNIAMVRLLLDAGCDTSKTAVGGHHPLAMASLGGHADVVTILLDAGADVCAVDSIGWTALMTGAQKGSCEVVRKLLERGADVKQSGPNGRSVLHVAARHGFDELVNVLIAAGADVNHADVHLNTPLRTAAYYGQSKCAYALLCAGANVSTRDRDGASPLHAAADNGFTDVIEVLLSAGGQADVNYEDYERRTPLTLASEFADAKAVNLLLDAGAHVNQPTAWGNTALYYPSDLKIVKALLDRGADHTLLNISDRTFLHAAGARGACAGVICALYRAGVDPTVKDNAGQTAADLARSEGHEDAAKLLDLLAAKHRALNST